MQQFVEGVAALVHRFTSHAVTVGSASARWLGAWRDLGFDFYQARWYDHSSAAVRWRAGSRARARSACAAR